jgi:hypothetical protein
MQGHVRQRGKNSWELRVYIGRDAATKRARYKTRTFKGSKRDADRAMRAFLAEVDRGVTTEGTFGELVERWFEVASTTRDWSPAQGHRRDEADHRHQAGRPGADRARQAPDAGHRRLLRAAAYARWRLRASAPSVARR